MHAPATSALASDLRKGESDMIATEVRNRFVTETQSQGIADRWNGVYSAMRGILDTMFKAQRDADRPTADAVAEAERAGRAEWEAERAAVLAQPVDGGRRDRADSEQTERGAR